VAGRKLDLEDRLSMRLVRYRATDEIRLGALADGGESVVDLQAAAVAFLRERGDPLALGEAAIRLPANTAQFLRGGERSQSLARAAFRYASAQRNDRGRIFFRPRLQVRLEPPLVPPLIVCGGGNFWDHLKEVGRDKPEHVEFFLKNAGSVLGPQDEIPYRPWASRKLDYEAELGIVVGKRGRCIPRERALQHVFGYTAVNDLAVRDRQLARWAGPTFHVKYGDGKVFDGNLVLGPALVSADEIENPMDLSLRCWVDGELRQDSNTSRYIWGIAEVIEYYSSMITLEPGFLVCPGTPGGCGVGSDPECGGRLTRRAPGSQYLHPGQTVVVEVDRVGRIANRVRAAARDVPAPGAFPLDGD
jgi:acylpyruvate hydrolase